MNNWTHISVALPLVNGIYQVKDKNYEATAFLNFIDGIWKGRHPISHVTISSVGYWKHLPPDPRMPLPNEEARIP